VTSDNQPFNTQARAFTLTELLIVIGIMGVLIGLLIPVVGGVRTRAWEAGSRNNLQVLAAAIDAYQRDYDAYPGPLSNDLIEARNPNPSDLGVRLPSGVAGFFGNNDVITVANITMSENLTLGLMGGLRWDDANGNQQVDANEIVYDPSSVGQGPASLNPRKPARTKAYLSDSKLLLWRDQNNLKTGQFQDDRGQAGDTLIPEFGDGFPEGLPVLYLRARNETRNESINPASAGNNNVIIDGTVNNGRGPFHLNQILGYTRNTDPIGVGTHGLNTVDISDTTIPNKGPINAYAFLLDPATPTPSPRGKGRYLLISPGADRTYGTRDDIANFGRVGN
jgi:prepilin-type N-terminal cleavage/methylation domain-containing protein